MQNRARPVPRIARFVARRAAAAACFALAAGGCREATTAPLAPEPAAVQVAFVDNVFRLTLLRAGELPTPTPVSGVVPFAAAAGTVAFFEGDTLRLLDAESGRTMATPVVGLPRNPSPRGALSADRRWLAFASGAPRQPIFIHLIDLRSGARDSVDITPTTDPITTLRVLAATPAFSPDGGRIGFLLATPLSVQLYAVERGTWRASVRTYYAVTATTEPLVGWPRWMPDESIRFLSRRRAADESGADTLLLLSVLPDSREEGAIVLGRAALPDSLALDAPRGFSFSGDGEAAVLTLAAGGRDGVFLLRRGEPMLEPLVHGEGLLPRHPIMVR